MQLKQENKGPMSVTGWPLTAIHCSGTEAPQSTWWTSLRSGGAPAPVLTLGWLSGTMTLSRVDATRLPGATMWESGC